MDESQGGDSNEGLILYAWLGYMVRVEDKEELIVGGVIGYVACKRVFAQTVKFWEVCMRIVNWRIRRCHANAQAGR